MFVLGRSSPPPPNAYNDPVVKALKALDMGELHSNEWTCTEGVVLYQGRVYIPDNPQLHHDLVHVHQGAGVMELLVARAVQICCQVHHQMQHVQPYKDIPYAEGGKADPQQGP